MKTLYISGDSWSETTREPSEDDEWDRGNTCTTWSFGLLSLSDAKYSSIGSISVSDDFEPGDKIYCVLAVYSTGDSFGYDDGARVEIISAHKDIKKADETVKILESTSTTPIQLPDEYRLDYLPWGGYFESLDYFEIHEGTLYP